MLEDIGGGSFIQLHSKVNATAYKIYWTAHCSLSWKHLMSLGSYLHKQYSANCYNAKMVKQLFEAEGA